MSPYIFVIATVLAIIPILIIFKVSMERIKEDPNNRAKAQIQFFIGAALSEVVPLILFVYGFSNISPVQTVNELYLPGIIILLAMGFATFFIFLQRMIDVDEELKDVANIFAMIGLSIASAIPIVSIVALFTMMP